MLGFDRLGNLAQSVGSRRQISKSKLLRLFQHFDSRQNVFSAVGTAAVEHGDIELHHRVFLGFGDIGQLVEHRKVAVDEEEIHQFLKVSRLFVRLGDIAVVSLHQRRFSEPVPHFLSVDLLAALERIVDISALDGELKPRRRILHESQCHLWISLLLQIRQNRLSAQLIRLDDAFHLTEFASMQRALKHKLCVVNLNLLDLPIASHARHRIAVYARYVQHFVQRLDDARIARRQRILHVSHCRVDVNLSGIRPRS
mmetsp:Transcript_71193/g.113169  ORF Transcript_71193/g.113169 Transcript_71193/m.113169 type:complete len:255 (+) Transcript_71193:426-1190(+)